MHELTEQLSEYLLNKDRADSIIVSWLENKVFFLAGKMCSKTVLRNNLKLPVKAMSLEDNISEIIRYTPDSPVVMQLAVMIRDKYNVKEE